MDIKLPKLNKDWALLYGILLGDGSIGKYHKKGHKQNFNYNMNITCNAFDDWPFINEIVLPLLKKITKREIPAREDARHAIRINICNKGLYYTLRKLGFPSGKKGPNVIIPKIFYNKNLIKYVVQGFFATDGCIVITKNSHKYYPRIEEQTIHKYLMPQVYNYLLSKGMNGGLYKSGKLTHFNITSFNSNYPKYRYQFNGERNLILFRNRIGFVNPKHQRRCADYLLYSEEYELCLEGIPYRDQSEIKNELDPIGKKFSLMPRGRFELPITSL